MKICSPQLGISPNSVLGGEVYDREILRGLAKRGVKIEVILPRNSNHDKNIKNWNITYIPFRHLPAILFNLFFLPYLFKVYRKDRFDILRLHSPKNIGLGALIFKIFHPEVKIVATYHQFNEAKIFGSGKLINKFWDHIICDSIYVKNKLINELNIDSKKITYIHNGVPSYLKPAKKDQKLVNDLNLEGKTALLFMGLFINRKNPLFLLKVLKNLKKENVVIIFWGSGPLKGEILKKAKELGVNSMVRTLKPVYGQEKTKIHNLADVFVHPAIDEGFALAPLESMACGKPVLMTKGYSASEAVNNGTNGFLCTENNVSDWSQKIQLLLNNKDLRKKMGKNSLKKANIEFTWSTAIEVHLDIFKRLFYETN